jgi:hypothetical protein
VVSLAELFAKEGVGLIPPEEGADLLRQEMLAAEPRPAELVVLAPPPSDAPCPLEISLERCPELAAHRLAGRPVVPVALALEWLAADARRLAHGRPFVGFDETRVLKGLILEGARPLQADLRSTPLDGRRVKQSIHAGGQPRVQATAVFGDAWAAEADAFCLRPSPSSLAAPPDYGVELFHGAAKILDGELKNKQFVAGDTLTVADFSLGATLNYAGMAHFPLEPYGEIRRWFAALSALPAWQKTVAETALPSVTPA